MVEHDECQKQGAIAHTFLQHSSLRVRVLRKKITKNKIGECEECIEKISCGTNLNEDEKTCLECNIHFMNVRDEGGLMWPKMNAVALCGIAITTFQAIMNDEKIMLDSQSSTTPIRVGLKATRDLLHEKTHNHFIFHSESDVCKNANAIMQTFTVP